MDLSLFSVSESVLIWLFCAAFIAGIVDAIAGGGGLITVPSMMLAGVPPLVVLGTNRLQAVIGETTALITYWLNKEIKLKGFGLGILTTAIGAVLGSYSVSLFSKEVLQLLLPILMVCITFYSILSKRMKNNLTSTARISNRHFMMICGLAIGFYNGFFGPGTGSIWMVAFVILLGVTIKKATIATKPLNLVGNLVSLMFFIGLGSVDFTLGLVMGAGQILGSVIGSKIVIQNGDKVVRPVFITVTLFMTVKLLIESDQHIFVSETVALISML